ncbi:putative TetR family transcriptional regulator [Actinacidiphila reveromycinica]|uniref:Putative TetR family transcriptional regulator n=1 Tax=Actinacidiphila reveromycinica TaxID=659352 RepID=A0A7U3VMN5_9ACTN|nr:TetR/AcrR family transcriptional regulator [Streptomyces sp. SN-593]BBA96815.1 putative TetR family transcriptional regulator [Streptomyces sp. SN-593]
MTGQRSDARRNHQRILAVAEAEVAARGADASLEQIARTAGVGSATVRRHFPTRQALLAAVFTERVEHLCGRARELAGADDSRAALLEWVRALVDYAVSARGLADALTYEPPTDVPADAPDRHSCGGDLEAAAALLLRPAARDGAVGPDVTAHDLVTLAVGIALATEHHRDPAAQAARLLRLAIGGLSPAPAPGDR